MKNVAEYLLLSSFRFLLLLFPFPAVQKLGKAFGSFVFYFLPVRKKLVLNNLRRSYPEKTEQEIREIARRNYRHIFATFFEIFWLSRLTANQVRKYVRMPQMDFMSKQLAKGKGLIMLSGHFGNWELIALAVGLLSNLSLTIIVKKQRNPYVDKVMTAMRTKFNNTVVDMDNAPREIIRKLRENGVVAMLADQSGPEEGLFINFFNRPASTHLGPAVFSLRTGAPIVMGFIIRNDNGMFDVAFEEIPMDDITGTDEEKIKTLTERHVKMLEKYVRLYPDQWLWMHKRWKHTEKYLQKHPEHSAQ